jgi:hypothetical protein
VVLVTLSCDVQRDVTAIERKGCGADTRVFGLQVSVCACVCVCVCAFVCVCVCVCVCV